MGRDEPWYGKLLVNMRLATTWLRDVEENCRHRFRLRECCTLRVYVMKHKSGEVFAFRSA